MSCPYYIEEQCYADALHNDLKPSNIPENLSPLCKTDDEWQNCERYKKSELSKDPDEP
jgi:hypothetical protein